MGAYFFQGKQLFVDDGFDDVTLADSVTAADLGAIRHSRDAIVIPVTGVAEVGLAEQNIFTQVTDVGVVTHQVEVPGTINGVAIHDGAHDVIVLHDKFAIHATGGILKHQFFGLFITGEVAGGEQINSGDF